jgi:prophage DNA circulation protein
MASWQDDLRPASFRGVAFKVESHQYTAGRRVTFHEFPNREKPYPEDLGKVGEQFKVDGYLIGDDIKAQLAKMKDAANAFGPGELVHPRLGTIKVQCGAFSFDESSKEGRIIKIAFQFYEAGDNRFPNNVDDKTDLLNDKALGALAATKNAFDNGFSIDGLPGFAVDTARKSVLQAANAFEKATKGLALKADQISQLAFNIRNLRAEVNDLIKAPSELSQRLQDSFALLQNALGGNKDAYRAVSAMTGFATVSDSAPYNTPTREKEKTNKTVFDSFMQQTATINAAQIASVTEFSSTDEVAVVREELVTNFETQVLNTPDDEVFQALEDVKAQVVRVLPDQDSNLPNVQSYALKQTTPSLVVAYDLFENVDSEQDLIDRNKIRNPAYIVGGQTLEVLDVRGT